VAISRDCFVPLDASKMRRGVLAMTEGRCIYVMTNNDVDYLMIPLILMGSFLADALNRYESFVSHRKAPPRFEMRGKGWYFCLAVRGD